jgi:UDP-glucose 4-epimerase
VSESTAEGSIVITGACSSLGRRLVRRLHRIRHVIALDARPFPECPKDVEHHPIEFWRRRVRNVLKRGHVEALVHAVGGHDEPSPREDRAENVAGFQHLLELVCDLAVSRVVLLSSASVYGPRAENPQLLTESAPLLGVGSSGPLRGLTEIDILAQTFLYKYPGIHTVVLRFAHVLGPIDNAPSNYLRLHRVPTLLGFDPMVQLLHIDDALNAVCLALAQGSRGIFNVAGPSPIALSRAIARLGRVPIALPHLLARTALQQLWALGVAAYPGAELEHLRYVCMVDDAKAREQLGFMPRNDLDATLRAVDEEGWP